MARIGRHEWPLRLTPPVRAFLEGASAALGTEFTPDDPEALLGKLGPISRIIRAVLRNTVNPTGLKAGYKVNVIPQEAVAEIDGRYLPGYEDEFLAEIDKLLGPGMRREFIHQDVAVETSADGDLYEAMTAALLVGDPEGRVVRHHVRRDGRQVLQPARHSLLRFAPLRLPADLDFSGMFHGIDERVPVDGLRFGVRVLDGFLDHC